MRLLRRRGCEHRWVARGTSQRHEWATATEILFVCGVCGDARTKSVAGRWTLDQITVLTDQDTADLFAGRAERR